MKQRLNEAEIISKINDIIMDGLNRAVPPDLDQNLMAYGADSLDSIEIVMAVEEEFEVAIGSDDWDSMDTVRKIAAFIDQTINACAS